MNDEPVCRTRRHGEGATRRSPRVTASPCPRVVALSFITHRSALAVLPVRHDERIKGFNVAVPYKQRILPLLDDVDAKAHRIGAVDTVTRDRTGRLIGSNAEGSGALASLTARFPGERGPFIDEPDGLQGLSVLLLGAGCAGRALV